MLTFWIYLIGIVDRLRLACGVSGLVLLFGSFFAFGALCDFNPPEEKRASYYRNLKIAVASAILLGCCAIFIPGSKTLASMLLIPAVVQNEQLQNITGNSLNALEKLTENWLRDLSEQKNTPPPEESI